MVVPAIGDTTDRMKNMPYFFLYWIRLNNRVKKAAPKKEIRFEKVLHLLLGFILEASTKLGPTYLIKAEILDAYMRVWLRLTYTPSVAFLLPRGM